MRNGKPMNWIVGKNTKIRGACTGRGRYRDFSGEHLTPLPYKTFTFGCAKKTFLYKIRRLLSRKISVPVPA